VIPAIVRFLRSEVVLRPGKDGKVVDEHVGLASKAHLKSLLDIARHLICRNSEERDLKQAGLPRDNLAIAAFGLRSQGIGIRCPESKERYRPAILSAADFLPGSILGLIRRDAWRLEISGFQ
jgi:hypothetical protein